MKMMKIIMPAVMVIFVLTSTASFGLYILASNVATIALGEITTLIVGVKKQTSCLRLCKDTKIKANHNGNEPIHI